MCRGQLVDFVASLKSLMSYSNLLWKVLP